MTEYNKMQKKFELKPPIMPNFITVKGLEKDSTIPVSELTEAEADEYAQLMKTTFKAHWIKKVAVK